MARWPRVLAAAVVVALLVLALAWPALTDQRRRSVAGAVYETSFAVHTMHSASVRLPWGVLQLSTTDPRTSLPADVDDVYVDVDVTWSVPVG